MKVLMLPDASQSNPYQRELAAALQKCDVQVTLCKFNRMPILRAIIACGKPVILHLHWTDGFIVARSWSRTLAKSLRFFLELLVVKVLGIKVVWTVHNLSNHDKIKKGYEIFVNRLLVRFYDGIIVHCLFAQKAVIRLYKIPDYLVDRIQVIPHGHYINCYENRITRKDARARLNYKEDTVLFLYLGSIRPYKGLIELLDAFHATDNQRIRLLIVGSPANEIIKAEVLRRCKTDCRIGTYFHVVPENEIQLFMNAADVAVFPFTDILTSGSVLLAMSFGKAIIVPRIGCIPETLNNQGGILYDSDDEVGLLEAIQKALSCDLQNMGRYNYDKVEQYDWEEIARKTREIYCRSKTSS
jgi:beta-1,4-mannosyltransferase